MYPFSLRRRAGQNRRFLRGTSLIEVTVALFISSSVLVTATTLATRVAAATDSANQMTRAYNVARQALENVRSYRGARLADGTYDAAQFGELNQILDLGPNSSATVTLDTYRAPVKRVTIAVRWYTSSPSHIRTITVTSLMTSGGVTP
jgi:Tfp pilus assembly protein PilV